MFSIARYLRGLLMAALVLASRQACADYPDYTQPDYAPQQPARVEVAPVGRQAAYADDEDLNRPAESRALVKEPEPRFVPREAEPRYLPQPVARPDRYPPHNETGAPAELASDVAPAPQSLIRGEPIPLAPQSQPGQRTLAGDLPPLVTGAASLGIVLGLFLLVVWVVRRGMPKSSAPLPREAFEMLGRAPLVGRQQAHLVRCGNKLLLLCISPNSVSTIAEINDPGEVERLTALCQANGHGGASFRHVLEQFTKPQRGFDYAAQHNDEPDFDHLDVLARHTQESHA